VDQLTLAGAHVAYESTTTTYGGRDYGTTTGVIHVRDLHTGKAVDDASDTLGRLVGSCWHVDQLVLAPAGTAAWEVKDHCSAPPPTHDPVDFIEALDDRTGKTTTLDTGGPGTIANLALYQCLNGCTPIAATFAWWTHSGSWRSTRIG
jgi:hypothetical protein